MSTNQVPAQRLRARKKPRADSNGRRCWLTILITCCVLGAIVAAPYSIGLLANVFEHSASAVAASEQAWRNSATAEHETMWCRRLQFDNENDRVLESAAPCDGMPQDANGNPSPLGTMRRLDAIAKSFIRK